MKTTLWIGYIIAICGLCLFLFLDVLDGNTGLNLVFGLTISPLFLGAIVLTSVLLVLDLLFINSFFHSELANKVISPLIVISALLLFFIKTGSNYKLTGVGAILGGILLLISGLFILSTFYVKVYKQILIPMKIFFIELFVNTKKIFISIGKGIVKFFKEQFMFIKNGKHTPLHYISYIVMGFGQMTGGQFIRGFLFFIIQIIFIYVMILFGIPNLSMFDSLGKIPWGQKGVDDFDLPIYGIIDSSVLILLMSVFSLVIIVIFIAFYFASIKASFIAQNKAKRQFFMYKDFGSYLKKDFKSIWEEIIDTKYERTLLSLPVLGVLIFTIVPLIYMILIAFTNYDKFHSPPADLFTWVGFKGIGNLLGGANAVAFWMVLGWTLVWAIFATFLNFIFGLGLAMLLNRKSTKFKKIFRTVFVLTIAVPQFVSLLLIGQLLGDHGLVNNLMISWGWIQNPIKFLSDPFNAKITVIVVNLWVGIPYTMLICSGLLMNIPHDLYESAQLDDASSFMRLRRITLPYIFFAIGPYLITQFVGNINNFSVIYLLTGGGPYVLGPLSSAGAGSTDLLVTWLFTLVMGNEKDYAMASSIGLLVFVVCAALSLIVYNKSSSVKNQDMY